MPSEVDGLSGRSYNNQEVRLDSPGCPGMSNEIGVVRVNERPPAWSEALQAFLA